MAQERYVPILFLDHPVFTKPQRRDTCAALKIAKRQVKDKAKVLNNHISMDDLHNIVLLVFICVSSL